MRVCVLGTGIMGAGIVSMFARSDKVDSVVWWGRSAASLDSGLSAVKKEITRYVKKNPLDSSSIDQSFSKISFTEKLSELTDNDIYIEAIVEDFDSKASLFMQLSPYIPDGAIVATNTSSLSVTALAMHTNQPSNFIGVHFFNPTSIMKLVEIIHGLTTSKDVLKRSICIVEWLGKSPVIVKESPGFIVNRMLIPMINEAIAILAEGVASKGDIDKAMKFGANHPIGPLALADLIGTDVCLSIMDSLHSETGDPKYRAHTLLRQYVRAGLFGRKSKKGFYKY